MSFISYDGGLRIPPILGLYLTGNKPWMERANASALGSTGWRTSGALFGEPTHMEPLNPHSLVLSLAMARAASGKAGGWVHKYVGRGKKRKRVKYFTRVGNSRRGTGGATDTIPFRRVRNSLRYRVHAKDSSVQIGFLKSGVLDWNLSRLVARQADETTLPITDAMRRFFFSAGFPRRKEAVVRRPARPWFAQTLERHGEALVEHFRERFLSAMQRYATEAAKS
jgi:hypothetical protein